MQSSFDGKPHVGIIMDGNGRWAARRGLPRGAGHEAGIEAMRRVLRAAVDEGVGTLTLYAFSSDNWRRPAAEVSLLMALLHRYLDGETEGLVRDGIRLSVIGRRDRLPDNLAAEIARSEAATEWGDALHLRVAIDYSGRGAILAAASGARADLTQEDFGALVSGDVASVDLIIRTGGEQRLSDFLLWECAYAELYFTPLCWPEFGAEHLAAALAEYRARTRRFGGLGAQPSPIRVPAPAR
jgi:undecaprenyl diphosphate synthase